MNKLSIILFTFCVLLPGGRLFAENANPPIDLSQYGYRDVLEIQATPQTPQPGENVRVEIESTSADLDRAEITWSVNGVVKKKGTGLKTLDVTAGKLGEKTSVTASALTLLGTTISARTSFTPGEVDLMWQADTYTPPFYRGKALFSTQSTLQVIAIPHIVIGNNEGKTGSQVYTWTQNGAVLGDQSGYGRNVLTIPSITLPRDISIGVSASNYNQTGTAVGTVVISPIPPKAFIYEDQPRLGVLFNKALIRDAAMADQEIHLVAFPYYFSAGTSQGSLKYEWSANAENISNFTTHNIVLRNIDDKTGVSAIHLVLKNPAKVLQYADTYLNLHFTSKKDREASL